MTWGTHPVCTHCWVEDNSILDPVDEDGMMIREPVRVREAEGEGGWHDSLVRCCKCGRVTASRIFIRANSDDVPFPANIPDPPGVISIGNNEPIPDDLPEEIKQKLRELRGEDEK